jgi:hypothetical protein
LKVANSMLFCFGDAKHSVCCCHLLAIIVHAKESTSDLLQVQFAVQMSRCC